MTFDSKAAALQFLADNALYVGPFTLHDDNQADNVKTYTGNVYSEDRQKVGLFVYVYDEGGPNEKAWFSFKFPRKNVVEQAARDFLDGALGTNVAKYGGTIRGYVLQEVDETVPFVVAVLYVDDGTKVVQKRAFLYNDGGIQHELYDITA